MKNQFTKRALLLGLVCLLLLGGFPSMLLPTANADNTYGPTIAAWLASDLMGVSYRSGGADPATGFDSPGFVYYVYQQLGVQMPRTLSEQAKFGVSVTKSELATGDLIFFRDANTSQAASVGIYLQGDAFVLVTSQSGEVVAHSLNESDYASSAIGARRVPQSAYPAFYEAVVRKAKELAGLPYKAGKADLSGADTAGLMQYIYGFFYLDVPGTLNELYTTGVSIARSNLRPGDMVFFKSLTTGRPYRVGMYLGDDQLIVTSSGLEQATLRSLNDAFYATRYMGARRPWASFVEAPANFRNPTVPSDPSTPSSGVADQIVDAALAKLGKPYKLGATGPTYYDCSGLTYTVFAQFGYKLPRASYSQATVGTKVRLQDLKKGDLVFFHDTWRNNGSIDHVAIYLGDGKIVHAITSGVTVSNLSGYWTSHFSFGRRIIDR